MSGSSDSASSSRSRYFETDYSVSGSSLESYSTDMTTPHKRGAAGASGATLDILIPRLREDTDGKLFEGATVERFVEHAWGVPPEEIAFIMSRDWTLDEESLRKYTSAKAEPRMYQPFGKMADTLTKSVRISLKKDESPMKLWSKEGKYVFKHHTSSRKPDMLSVLKDAGDPSWLMVYIIIEFKKKQRSTGSGSRTTSRGSSSLAGIPERASTVGNSSSSGGSPTPHPRARIPKDSGSRRSSRTTNNPTSATSSKKRKFAGSADDPASKRARSSDSTSSRITNDQMQLATYALEAMAASTRHYSTGILIDKSIMSLWYYDRTCIIRTINFDFEEEPAKLALVLYAMSNCDTTRAGFDPFLYPDPTVAAPIRNAPVTNIIGAHFVLPRDGQTAPADVRFCIKSILSEYRGLIGRGTMVYQVSRINGGGRLDDDQVLKLSWPVVLRTREATTIETLLRVIPEWKDHLPEVHFSATYTAEHLKLPRFELLKSHPEKEKLEDRALHVLGMSLYKKLWEVDSVEEFQDAFVDCVECHYHAYKTGKVLHRDLSENNLMFKSTEGRPKGIVNDWDMASHLDSAGEVTTSTARHRTGTVPFMARDLLVDEPPVHLYRHDLESFFYILVWAAVHFDIQNKTRLPTHPALKKWDDDSLDNACNAKSTFLFGYERGSELVFRHVRQEFSRVLENWILPLWDLFFDVMHHSKARPRGSMPSEFDNETLGGRLTFDTFMATIGRVPR